MVFCRFYIISCMFKTAVYSFTVQCISEYSTLRGYDCCTVDEIKIQMHVHLLVLIEEHSPSQGGGELSKRLGGNVGFKDKNSPWDLMGFSRVRLVLQW